MTLQPGIQPEEDGRLLCRYCGGWFRSLGHHLVGPRHGIAVETYREAFELPATRALMAADLREGHAQRARERLEASEVIREAFAVDRPDDPQREQRRVRGLQRKAETQSRAGVHRSKQAVGAMLGKNSRRRAAQRRRDLDQRARQLGFDDLERMLHATTELTHAELGKLMSWEPATAKMWRDRHGVRSDAKAAAARQRTHAAAEDDQPDAEPTGEQPADRDGRLRCLECDTSWNDLGKHVEHTHRMAQATYRRRHRLPADRPLHSAPLDQQKRETMAAVGRASGQARRDRYRARYDQLARAAGYNDVEHLLALRSNREVAQLLKLDWVTSAARLRRKYGSSPTSS